MSDGEQLKYIKEFTGVLLDKENRIVGFDLTKNELDWLIEQAEENKRLQENINSRLVMTNQIAASEKSVVFHYVEKNNRLRQALKFYANEKSYEVDVETQWGPVIPIDNDGGSIARAALEDKT